MTASMRSSRLLAILILLQLRQRLTAETLAAEFEVSVRTIYRDIDALSAAGIPVYADRGPGGGFALLDGYRTRLTGLDPSEAEALAWMALPEQSRAIGLAGPARRARDKLLAALPGDRARTAGRVAGMFHLDPLDWYRAARPTPHLAQLARAVLDSRMVTMRYSSWTGVRDWQVEPLGLVAKGGGWYLVARGHGKVRMFNAADLVDAPTLGEPFERPEDFDLAKWWPGAIAAFERRLRPLVATLRASPAGLERIAALGAHAQDAVAVAGAPDADGWRTVQLPIESTARAALDLMRVGGELVVLDPPELAAALAFEARAILARMEGGSP